MMLKSKSTTDIVTQTDSSLIEETIWNSLDKHNRTEMRTVESFDKHSILLLLLDVGPTGRVKSSNTKFGKVWQLSG